MDAGVRFGAADLDAADLLGLRALEAAGREFAIEHPQCPGCGRPLASQFAAFCSACGWKKAAGI
jgi:hypothetical protein